MDFLKQCVEEIALEGLDGITISSLWLRLENRSDFLITLDNKSKSFLWKCILSCKDLEFYELLKPRPSILLTNRYENIDSETGVVIELEHSGEYPYPINIIKDKHEKGSCSTYHTRKKITDILRDKDLQLVIVLEEAIERWGDKLVIVACQTIRTQILLDTEVDPKLELTEIQYCILEKVGRSRYMGEVTLGKHSLASFGESPKTMFYHRKILLKYNLLTKQNYFQRSLGGHATNGKIFHLKRFFVEIPSKTYIFLEKICDILSEKENHMELLSSVKDQLNIKDNSFKKLYQLLNSYLKVMVIPYRTFFPNAPELECLNKHGSEKMVRVIKMIQKYNPLDMKDEEDGKVVNSGICDVAAINLNETLLRQALVVIEKKGPEGVSQMELSQLLGVPKLESRLILRNLEKKNVISSIMKDEGRQRLNKFVALTLQQESQLHSQFEKERQKVLELTQTKQNTPVKDASLPDRVDTWTSSENGVIANAVFETSKEKDKEDSFIDHVKNFSTKRESVHLTYRKLKRTSLIIETVRKAKLIDSLFMLQKVIITEEQKEGCNIRIDKKSVLRLINKLVKDGQVNVLRLKLKQEDKVKTLLFICDPSVDLSDPLIHAAIEQAKFKHFAASKEFVKQKQEEKKKETIKKTSPLTKKKENPLDVSQLKGKLEYMPGIGRQCGLEPKMIRLKTIHQLLFYLVYGQHPLSESCNASFTGETTSEYPQVYSEIKSWKMFIPPLPHHKDYGPGWCLISDVILRFPVSLFCKCVNITFNIEGLSEYIEDPVKKHYLVWSLPPNIRNYLLFARKYIFTIHEILTRLAYMGLLSFGPQQHKEKDQVFVYVHKKAVILDTTSSEPHYHLTSDNIPYEKLAYTFNFEQDLEQYWFDLERICINTRLGFLHSVQSSSITIERLESKASLADCLIPRTPNTVVDNGLLPGDCRGAAGLDSSLFAHLRRNWVMPNIVKTLINKNLSSKSKENETAGTCRESSGINLLLCDRKKRLPRLSKNVKLPLSISTVQDSIDEKSASLPEVVKVTMENIQKGLKRKKKNQNITKPSKVQKKSGSVARPVKQLQKKIRKQYYDERDQMALRCLTKERVSWTSQEDSLLLLCKVASSVLNNNRETSLVPWTLVRDIMHESLEEAKDKTSKSCQRRICYILKNPQTAINLNVHIGEALQDKKLVEKYRSTKIKSHEFKQIEELFRNLLNDLKLKFRNSVNTCKYILPSTMEELSKNYTIVTSGLNKVKSPYTDIKNIVDIHCSVLHNLIFSSLHNPDKNGSCLYQLHKLFKQYPDNMLRSVIANLKKHRVISERKSYDKRRIRSLLSITMQYHLSHIYGQLFSSRYQSSIFPESYAYLQKLKENKANEPFNVTTQGGETAVVVTLMALNLLNLNITLPDEIIKLNQFCKPTVRRGLILDSKMSRLSSSEMLQSSETEYARNDQSFSKTKCNTGELSPDTNSLTSLLKKDSDSTAYTGELSSDTNSLTSLLKKDSDSTASGANWEGKSTSRLILFVLRQQIINKPSVKVLKVFDGISINSCIIDTKLKDYSDDEVLNSTNCISQIFNEAHRVQPLEKVSEIDCLHLLKEYYSGNDNQAEDLIALYRFMNKQRELGLLLKNILDNFKNLPVMEYLNILLERQLVLRVGMGFPRYVTQEYAQPWLINSFKVEKDRRLLVNEYINPELCKIKYKSNERNKLQMIEENFTDKVLQEENKMEIEVVTISDPNFKCEDVIKVTPQPTKQISTINITNSNSSVAISKDVQDLSKAESSGTSINKSVEVIDLETESRNNDLEQASKSGKRKRSPSQDQQRQNIDNIFEPVSLIARPWRRPDGTLNKHVLKKLLESILMRIMTFPGITQKNVFNWLHPAYQPVAVLELLEMLEKAGCVITTILKLPPAVTLFSSFPGIENGSYLDENILVCYEPTLSCIIKMGQLFSSLRTQLEL